VVFGAGRGRSGFRRSAADHRGCEELRRSIEQEVRYANITIIEGNQASQFGIGMVSARIAQIVLRDERGVIPIGSYNPTHGVTLSMPSVLGQTGIVQIWSPRCPMKNGKPCSGAPKR
jgi:malate/lactate dehydrogenase